MHGKSAKLVPSVISNLYIVSVLNIHGSGTKHLNAATIGLTMKYFDYIIMHWILVMPFRKIRDSMPPNMNSAFAASTKPTQRLQGSSEHIAAWQPNHDGSVPGSKWHIVFVSTHKKKWHIVLEDFYALFNFVLIIFAFLHMLQMDGFQDFEARRRKKFDKQIDSNVMMSSTALDEGIDLH
jgi:hypothetical protein